MSYQDFFTGRGITPKQIVKTLTKNFGKAWFEWEPLSLEEEIEDLGVSFEGFPQTYWDRIMASRLCALNDVPWHDWNAFMAVSQALNLVKVDFDFARPCSPSEYAWAIWCMHDIKPDTTLDPLVQNIVSASMLDDGISVLPQPYLTQLNDNLIRLSPYEKDVIPFNELVLRRYALAEDRSNIQEETPVNVHVIKLIAIDNYVENLIQNGEALCTKASTTQG